MLKVVIIGAGMSGVVAAKMLNEQGFQVMLIEKSRGLGGRMSTRRMAATKADHGAQYFSIRSKGFQKEIEALISSGVVKPWQRYTTDEHPRYVATQGMSTIPKALGKDLNVCTNERVAQVEQVPGGFCLLSENKSTWYAENIIATMPAPQAVSLLEKSLVAQDCLPALREIEYQPCYALMLHTSGAVELTKNFLEPEPFAWQMSNRAKGMTSEHSYTLHTSQQYALKNIEKSKDEVRDDLMKHLPAAYQVQDFKEVQLHKWRYSIAVKRHPDLFLKSKEGIYFGGDGFGIGNVEGAYLSGVAMAQDILSKK